MNDIRPEEKTETKLPGWALFLFGMLSSAILFLTVAVIIAFLYAHSIEKKIDEKDNQTKREVYQYMSK